ncbi:unnamed protein product [Rotaria magnacalcarata]|uniref:Alanine--tRNA ligase n=1 Tax=Rotaria magnacalcarata TaxID=392030 RepID=A0A819B2M6_9BILA|nr:unnamed protein product [Rotaria magnacalcarata]
MLQLFINSSYRFVYCARYYSTNHQLQWSSSRVRQTFIDYFTRHSQIPHINIPSSSVIPPKDAGTYYVNSGMNQFKSIFLSHQDKVSKQCVVNYQKCIRVGGKHNDLSDVGHDTYHHTFFEMLGNWSFNNSYFKREACTMAYDLLTRIYGIEKNRLFFTYFNGENNLIQPDYETKQIWMDLGIDSNRILPFGMKENFWEMSEVGPCGPCTEIHYDHTSQGDPLQVNRDNPRVVELWNLVFMQYERRQDKSLIPLHNCHVDTGMGLERLVAVLNSFESNYDTDLFTPLFDTIHSYCHPSCSIPVYSQANKNQQYAYRLLADHVRMFTIAIGDGLIPEKKGIGGLLKKMIERATRIAYEYLHIDEENVAIISKLIPITTQILSQAYPDLNEKLNRTMEIIKYCEVNYMKKYKLAKPLLEKFIQDKILKSDYFISGDDIYRLYAGKINHVNVPLEMIEDYTRLFPVVKFDWSNFEELMREETRKSKIFSVYNKTIKTNENVSQHPTDKILDLIKQCSSLKQTIDEPYKYQADKSLNAKVQLIIQNNNSKNQLTVFQSIDKNCKYYVLLDQTNFYSTGGGQTFDHGKIQFSNNLIFQVENVFRLHEHILHYGYFLGNENIDDKNVVCCVDMKRRLNLSRNHTTTHLVNRILRELLNDSNLIQKASLIHEDYFIFEYSSINTNANDNIFEELEKRVNETIDLNLPISISSHKYNSIRSDLNIYRLSNELYPSDVRCVNIGESYSRELCCGTHVSSTNEIEDFLIVRVDSKGQSNKRLYCLTGSFAKNVRYLFENDFQKQFHYLKQNHDQISVDELYSQCRKLREIYLDEKSLLFPFNQRSEYLNHWHKLMPDKKILRKYLLNQLNEDSKKNFIHSNVDLPIYDIGYMLLRYDDENNTRKHQPYVIYINFQQRLMIVYLKNPRQRSQLIEKMRNQSEMTMIENFENYDQQTQDLFTTTKKLIVFKPIDKNRFDRMNFQQMCDELF